MKRVLEMSWLLVLLCGLVACEDDSTKPGGDEGFSVVVQVEDGSGAPVEGLDVVLWNFSDSLMDFLQDAPKAKRMASVVPLRLAQRSVCDLMVYDLEDRLVQALAEGDTLEAGQHQFVFGVNVEVRAGVQVYRCDAEVRDVESGEVTYEHSIYMTAVLLDPARMQLSRTDASGRVRYDDETLVPGRFELPPLQARDESANPMGTFELGAELMVRVLDGSGHHVDRTVVLHDGTNRVDLVWDPAVPREIAPIAPGGARIPRDAVARDAPLPDLETELSQNFPNPFN